MKYMKKQQTAKAKDKGNKLRGVIATYVPCGFQRTETIDVDTINLCAIPYGKLFPLHV